MLFIILIIFSRKITNLISIILFIAKKEKMAEEVSYF